jgi:hypothetical protein
MVGTWVVQYASYLFLFYHRCIFSRRSMLNQANLQVNFLKDGRNVWKIDVVEQKLIWPVDVFLSSIFPYRFASLCSVKYWTHSLNYERAQAHRCASRYVSLSKSHTLSTFALQVSVLWSTEHTLSNMKELNLTAAPRDTCRCQNHTRLSLIQVCSRLVLSLVWCNTVMYVTFNLFSNPA